MFEKLTTLTFITSESCNLNCSYCEIAKNANDYHFKEAEKVRESLITGSYVNKYKELFLRQHINPEQIVRVELWGQEPTLTLNEFTTQFYTIMNWLPKVKEMFFSTNGIAYPERIINLIKEINKYFILYNERHFKLIIQFSLDGISYTKENRNIEPEIILNNITYIVNELNKITLTKNFQIGIRCHGVITTDNIKKELQNSNNNYWVLTDQELSKIYQLNKNMQVFIEDFSAFLQAPYNASKKEGQLLAEYLEQCMKLNDNYNFVVAKPFTLFHSVAKGISLLKDKLAKNNYDVLENIIDNYNFDFNDICDTGYIGLAYGCGIGVWDIKMRYDGTLLYCQNALFGLNEQDLKNKIGITYDIQRAQLNNKIFQPNLFSSKKEDIEQFLNLFDTSKRYTQSFTVSNVLNFMYILLQNHQIDESYQNNYKKLLLHAMYLAIRFQCYYNNLTESGSMYNLTLGTIRFYCNGALDKVEEYLKERPEVHEFNLGRS